MVTPTLTRLPERAAGDTPPQPDPPSSWDSSPSACSSEQPNHGVEERVENPAVTAPAADTPLATLAPRAARLSDVG